MSPAPEGGPGLYRRVLGLAFPSGYPGRLLDQAARTFREARRRVAEARGTGAARRYAARALVRAVADGLAERGEELRAGLSDLSTGWGGDLRYALRQLVRRPLLALVAVVSLSVGIGANTLLFSAVDTMLLAPLPVPDADRLVRIFDPDARRTLRSALTPEAIEALDRSGGALEGVTGTARLRAEAEIAGTSGLVDVELVAPGFFRVLRVPPARGRGFGAADAASGAGRVAVLSHRFWREEAGADPGIVGRTLRLNREAFTVVGIAAEGFGGTNFASHADLWAPTSARAVLRGGEAGGRRTPWLAALGRLAPGASLDAAEGQVGRVMAELHRRAPDVYADTGWFVLEERAGLINPDQPALVPLAAAAALGAALVVLLVACLNVAGLALARAVARRRELGVRLALGAGRARLARQMLVESALLVVPAVGAGLWVAGRADRLLTGVLPVLSRLDVVFEVDARMLAFTAGTGILAVLLSGTLPALFGTRSDPREMIGGRGEVGSSARRPLHALATTQVAFTAAVLVLGGLFLQTLRWYEGAGTGYAVADRVAVEVDVGLHGLDESEGRAFFRELVREAEALPSVERAALAGGVAAGGPTLRVGPEGDEDALGVGTNLVGPGYFETLEIGVREGRGVTGADREDGEAVAVINQTLARALWPGESPVGRLLPLRSGPGGAADPEGATEVPGRTSGGLRVVGVVDDVKVGALAAEPRPFAYLPAAQHYRERMTLVAATDGAGAGVVPGLRDAVDRLRPGLPLADAYTLEAFVDEDRLLARAAATLGAALGGLSLFLAAVGIYGTLAFTVRRRRPELAVRIAMGAGPSRIVRSVLGRGARLAGLGLAVGLPAGVLAAAALRGLLVGASTLEPVVLVAVPAVLAAVVLVALSGPAASAASLKPVEALREE